MASSSVSPESRECKTVIDLFCERVFECPKAIAASFKDRYLTYVQLDSCSSNLAAQILEEGVGPGDCVVVLAIRSLEMLIFFLAVLKAGACYVPIDLGSQKDAGIRRTIERVKPKLVLCSNSRRCNGFRALSRTMNQDLHGETEGPDQPFVPTHVGPSDLAYIVFTSGTTSEPKGVMVPHRAISNYVQQCSEEAPFNMDVRRTDSVLLTFSPAFDACTAVIFCTLCNGGVLLLSNPEDLEVSVADSTIVPATPSILRSLKVQFPGDKLRAIFLGGETPDPGLLAKWQKPGRKIYNCYGPSETTCTSLITALNPNQPISLGQPMPNSKIILLDTKNNDTDEGEICISGPGLARGYFEDDQLTSEKFFMFAGERFYRTGDFARRQEHKLYFLGRQDALIKNRGFLVNLDRQVIPALQAQPEVEEAIVIQHGGTLVAFVAPHCISSESLRNRLARLYDTYLIPDRIIALERLPVSANRKIDIRVLRDSLQGMSSESSQAIDATYSKLELLKCAIAHSARMSVSDVNTTHSFYELGGNSLSALQVLSDLWENGMTLSMGQLFDADDMEQVSRCMKPTAGNSFQHNDGFHEATSMTNIQERLILGTMKLDDNQYFEMTFPCLSS